MTALSFSDLMASKLSFQKISHNFGTVIMGSTRQAVFAFKNNSRNVIRILSFKADCGCTVINREAIGPYYPNETGQISVHFDSQNFSNRLRKSIVITTDEPYKNKIRLTISAKIVTSVKISPMVIDFFPQKSPATTDRVITVQFKKPVPRQVPLSELIQFRSNAPDFFTSRIVRQSATRFLVSVSLKKTKPFRPFYEPIYLKIYENPFPIKVLAVGHIKPIIYSNPGYFDFGVIYPNRTKTLSIQIKSSDASKLKLNLSEVGLDNKTTTEELIKFASIDLKAKSRQTYTLVMKLEKPPSMSGKVSGIFTFKTNTRDQALLVIPFYGFFNETPL